MNKAFTMLELIFTIVVIGILAAIIIPSTKTNPLQEAALQLASHIRYTQHLAMVDDRYNPNRTDVAGNVIWYKERWQLVFSKGASANHQVAYTIFSDTYGNAVSRGDPNEVEIAKNPENINQRMTGGYSGANSLNITHASFVGMKKLNLGMSYGVTSVSLNGGCSAARISFDYLGRPITGDNNTMSGPYTAPTPRLVSADCNIMIKDSNDNNITIRVTPETGYVKILF